MPKQTKEYLYAGAHKHSLQHRLNEFAKDGWTLVSVMPCIRVDYFDFVMTRDATGEPVPTAAMLRDMHTEHDALDEMPISELA